MSLLFEKERLDGDVPFHSFLNIFAAGLFLLIDKHVTTLITM